LNINEINNSIINLKFNKFSLELMKRINWLLIQLINGDISKLIKYLQKIKLYLLEEQLERILLIFHNTMLYYFTDTIYNINIRSSFCKLYYLFIDIMGNVNIKWISNNNVNNQLRSSYNLYKNFDSLKLC